MTPSIDALQSWLALEHQAVWLYPVIGARHDDLLERATEAYEDHRDVRDRLVTQLRGLGEDPASGELSYDVGRLRSQAQARLAARRLERSVAAACLALVDATEGDDRGRAIRSLTRAAQAELTWGGEPKAFPGLP